MALVQKRLAYGVLEKGVANVEDNMSEESFLLYEAPENGSAIIKTILVERFGGDGSCFLYLRPDDKLNFYININIYDKVLYNTTATDTHIVVITVPIVLNRKDKIIGWYTDFGESIFKYIIFGAEDA